MSGFFVSLPERTCISVSGQDARGFLQGLLTINMSKISPSSNAAGALLSPQGKILFDCFVSEQQECFLIETATSLAGELAKRLNFYKLKANVTISHRDDLKVVALWGEHLDLAYGLADPRFSKFGLRTYVDKTTPPNLNQHILPTTVEAYHERRIAFALAEALTDYEMNDIFPHDANLDLLNGVDFHKGCYVGQEVVSRMHHRTEIRKRFIAFSFSDTPPQKNTPIYAGDQQIGHITSTSAKACLALVRLDKMQAAIQAHKTLNANECSLAPLQPPWLITPFIGAVA